MIWVIVGMLLYFLLEPFFDWVSDSISIKRGTHQWTYHFSGAKILTPVRSIEYKKQEDKEMLKRVENVIEDFKSLYSMYESHHIDSSEDYINNLDTLNEIKRRLEVSLNEKVTT